MIVGICLLAGCSSEKNREAAKSETENSETAGSADNSAAPETLVSSEEDKASLPDEGTENGAVLTEESDGSVTGADGAETSETENGIAGSANTADTGENTDSEPENGETAEVTPEPLPDTTPPVFKEYRSHLVYIGDTVSYRSGVILTDDSGEEPVLSIDSSKVNLKEAGEYPLTYTATDAAGNTSTCEVTVVVREREDVTQEMLDAKADEIIDELLGDSDRDIEALEKLFKWTKKNIHYVNYFEQKDDISAAWEGLMYERGDCYVYACASKELLTRAGFKNDMIRTARHYWNLVDLGEGWYHYDTCPRKDKPYFFMWGDEQLMEYSKANGNSHDYDHTKWPDVMP